MDQSDDGLMDSLVEEGKRLQPAVLPAWSAATTSSEG
uniref:Uncharacterized protein n=1 Tax=Arundo donax TaxID=35708 RepID=A0A0A8YMT2_ARUDO